MKWWRIIKVSNHVWFIQPPDSSEVEKFVYLTNGDFGEYENVEQDRFPLERRCSLSGLTECWKKRNETPRSQGFKLRPWCGTLETHASCPDVPFMTVNVPREGCKYKREYNPHLIRYYMERVWKLKRPGVIISVTGGAKSFDMRSEEKDELMKAIMDETRKLDVWFITGGTKSGIMQVCTL